MLQWELLSKVLYSRQSAYVWPQWEHSLKPVKVPFSTHDLRKNPFLRACSSYWWWWGRWNIKIRQNIHQIARVLKSQSYHLPLPVTSQHEDLSISVAQVSWKWRNCGGLLVWYEVFTGFRETVGWWKLYFMQFKYIFPVRMMEEDNEVRFGLMGQTLGFRGAASWRRSHYHRPTLLYGLVMLQHFSELFL